MVAMSGVVMMVDGDGERSMVVMTVDGMVVVVVVVVVSNGGDVDSG
jgi:hypothetical protein